MGSNLRNLKMTVPTELKLSNLFRQPRTKRLIRDDFFRSDDDFYVYNEQRLAIAYMHGMLSVHPCDTVLVEAFVVYKFVLVKAVTT